MKRLALPLALVLGACTTTTTTSPGWNTTPAVLDAEFHPINRGWGAPVWQDEFNGTKLDLTKWVAARFCGGYNNEYQCYTDRMDNLHVWGGALTIHADKADEPQEMCDGDPIGAAPNEAGTVNCPPSDPTQPDHYFTSGRIHTRVAGSGGPHAWKYGRIEIRAVLPWGPGTWTAFWMLPVSPVAPADHWPRSGEIDLMEAVNINLFYSNISPAGYDPNDYIQSNIHLCSDDAAYAVDQHASQMAEGICQAMGNAFHKVHKPMSLQLGTYPGVVVNLTLAYHTYAMEWSDVDMRFFVDDQLVGQIAHGADPNNAPFRQDFYLIINLAVGGDMPGPPIPSYYVDYTAQLGVDWVRVYACTDPTTSLPDPTAKACIYQGTGLGKAP
jgi:beta-glucanase (GH16 family)